MSNNLPFELVEKSKIITRIGEIRKQGAALDDKIQAVALSAVYHGLDVAGRDPDYIRRLYVSMPNGSRRDDLLKWMVEFFPVHVVRDKKGRVEWFETKKGEKLPKVNFAKSVAVADDDGTVTKVSPTLEHCNFNAPKWCDWEGNKKDTKKTVLTVAAMVAKFKKLADVESKVERTDEVTHMMIELLAHKGVEEILNKFVEIEEQHAREAAEELAE